MPILEETMAVTTPEVEEMVFPTSFAQQRLWFLDQWQPGSSLYNTWRAIEMVGALDSQALQRALTELALRHESLRTTFRMEDGQAVQVISLVAALPLDEIDLSAYPLAERRAIALQRAEEATRWSFDLTTGPLSRALLLRLDEERTIFVWTLHHIITDGWSMRLLLAELAELYNGFAAGRPAQLPEPPIQYADFASWQRDQLQGDELASLVDFWRGKIGDAPALDLPVQSTAEATGSAAGSCATSLGPEIVWGLQELVQRCRVTLSQAILAAYKIVLGSFTSQDDIVVGTPVANRDREELEGLVGFLVNTLVVRSDLAGDPTVIQVMERVRDNFLEAYAHQDLPFEKLVEELRPEGQTGHVLLFQALFLFLQEEFEAEDISMTGLRWRALEIAPSAAKLDLTLVAGLRGERLELQLDYARERLEDTTVRRILDQLARTLGAMATNGELRRSQLPRLSAEEHHQIVLEWGVGDAPDRTEGTTIQDLLLAPARQRPDAVALVFEEQTVTYGELDRRSDRLARHLRATLGGPDAAPESLVAIFLERSPELVVAILAAYKAGAAYMPLDPEAPADRLGWQIEDSCCRAILTNGELSGRLPRVAAQIVRLEDTDGGNAGDSAAPAFSLHDPDRLAYVIYTSGSTGRPKGVAISHRGYRHLVAAQWRLFGLGAADRVLQFSSLTFDASVWEIGMTLSVGATLVLAPRPVLMPGAPLGDLLASRKVTTITLPPTALAALDAVTLPALSTLVVAGEACPPELARRWSPGRRFFNAYGPTETTVCATAGLFDGGNRLPIGRPIAGARVQLLDRQLGPVPAGVAGMLHVAGPGLARGYLARPALTAERFVPDARNATPGGRIYNTGDLARHDHLGRIEFLGRIDHQVKVRGFRMELGEIEAAASAQPEIEAAVAVAREDPSGDQRVVLYVVPAGHSRVREDDLRDAMGRWLPSYMVPSATVVLDALPINASGKVDRAALPAPGREASTEDGASPRTPTEELIAGIWAEILQLDSVGIEADFFAIGGHSLLATKVMSRIADVCGVELPLRQLFEQPTIAALAGAVDAAEGAAAPPIHPRTSAADRSLSFSQERLWFLQQMAPESSTYNVFTALALTGPLEIATLAKAVEGVAERHQVLRSIFPPVGGRPVQRLGGAIPQLAQVDLSGLSAGCRTAVSHALAAAEARRPFDLSTGPLLRVSSVRLAADEHVLFLAMHHIVSDLWSMEVLAAELATAYGAFVAGEQPRPRALPVQYADYAEWQREWLSGQVLRDKLDFWLELLAGAPAALDLPTDRPRPAVRSLAGNTVVRPLPVDLARQAASFGQRHGATLFMTTLATFGALLLRYSGDRQPVVGSFVANRERRELEDLVGFFVNTLALRLDGRGDPSFRDLVARTRRMSLAAYRHQDLPFERLVEEIKPDRGASYSPIFQVAFALNLASADDLAFAGLETSLLPLPSTTAKFDLGFLVAGAGDNLTATVEYRTELFDRTTIGRLLGHFESLLTAALADPATPLSRLALLRPSEVQQLCREGNDTALDLPADAVFQEQVAAVWRTNPNRKALIYEERTLSWREVDEHSARLARRLRRLGVRLETPVATFLERSPEHVIALLAILRAGGVYVPLLPSLPAERLHYLLDDSQVAAIVTTTALAERLPETTATLFCLDGEAAAIAGETPVPPEIAVEPENVAYMIYTSGSTGRPKGTLVSHRALVNLMLSQRQIYAIGPQDRVLQFSSATFDASFFDIALALGSGAPLVLAPREKLLPSWDMVEVMRQQGVTTVGIPPSVMTALPADATLPDLHTLTVGGEACSPEVLARWAPGRRFFNAYGPTETTVITTYSRYRGDGRVPSIGYPLPNQRAAVLDRDLLPLPAGVPGQLAIGGPGVARGYHRRPRLTAEKFVPDPLAIEAGGRLYCTGDLVRYLGTGELDFLGRIDLQVKVRGFRIELGEVEAALAAHEAVREVVVDPRRSPAGAEQLVAYVVPHQAHALDPAELVRFLGAKLPEYAVPAAFVVLESLPLTDHGKVDRRALPDPQPRSGTASTAADEEVASELEAAVREIWKDVLEVPDVGLEESFFELGGTSLLIARVQARLRDELGHEVAIIDLFQFHTIRGLCGRLLDTAPAEESAGAARVEAREDRRESTRRRREARRQRRRGRRRA